LRTATWQSQEIDLSGARTKLQRERGAEDEKAPLSSVDHTFTCDLGSWASDRAVRRR
jgi:hypothetical protein